MQPIIKENVSVTSVGKNIASSRLGHREFESRNFKFFTRISRQNKRYTNMDLAIPTCSMPSSKCTSNSPFSRFLSCSSLQLVQIAIKSKQQQKTIRIAAHYEVPHPYTSLPDTLLEMNNARRSQFFLLCQQYFLF